MPTPVQSINSPIELSTDNVNWKVLICTQSWNLDVDTPINNNDTMCGRLTGLGITAATITVQAVSSYEQAFIQVSYNDCLDWQTNSTHIYFRVQSPVFGSYGLGSAYYLQGTCYISKTTLINDTAGAQPVKFSVTLNQDGVLDITA